MSFLTWILFGLIVGIIAKFLMPGKDPGGFAVTILLGIGGAFVGGYFGTLFGFGDLMGFDFRSMVMAIGGAIVLLIVYRMLVGRESRA